MQLNAVFDRLATKRRRGAFVIQAASEKTLVFQRLGAIFHRSKCNAKKLKYVVDTTEQMGFIRLLFGALGASAARFYGQRSLDLSAQILAGFTRGDLFVSEGWF